VCVATIFVQKAAVGEELLRECEPRNTKDVLWLLFFFYSQSYFTCKYHTKIPHHEINYNYDTVG